MKKEPTKQPNKAEQTTRVKDLEPKQNPKAGAATRGINVKFTLFNPDGTPLRSS